jgi:hypothetical protein
VTPEDAAKIVTNWAMFVSDRQKAIEALDDLIVNMRRFEETSAPLLAEARRVLADHAENAAKVVPIRPKR